MEQRDEWIKFCRLLVWQKWGVCIHVGKYLLKNYEKSEIVLKWK